MRKNKNIYKKNVLDHTIKELLGHTTDESIDSIAFKYRDFFKLLDKYFDQTSYETEWHHIKPIKPSSVFDYADMEEDMSYEEIRTNLRKLVVVKLNGGLGTTMGCTGPKSVIPVRENHTFLDLIVEQIQYVNQRYKVCVPLVLMNSFNTDKETKEVIQKYSNAEIEIYTFEQSKFPRLSASALLPILSQVKDINHAWYPPGHGDFYNSFYHSNLWQKLVHQGKEYIFSSNCDNLGSTIDVKILKYFNDDKDITFAMEVTPKTKSDIKGGTLINFKGETRLLEIAQVPSNRIKEFKNIQNFKLFNTNNIWIKFNALKDVIENATMDLDVIVNPKRTKESINVIQLETAIGSGIKCFNNVIGINVPRSRFLPVKTTSDLLLLMSDLYVISHGTLVINPERQFLTNPLIKLGEDFKTVRQFSERFSEIPKISELDHLTVSGNVTFGKNTTLKGTVIIVANHGDQIDLPDGCKLENKIVSGNLRILEH